MGVACLLAALWNFLSGRTGLDRQARVSNPPAVGAVDAGFSSPLEE